MNAKKIKIWDLQNKVFVFLKDNLDKRFTAREIADWIFKTYPEECREKQERSTARKRPLDTEAALLRQIAAEISAYFVQWKKGNFRIKNTEGRPRKYYFTELEDSEEIERIENSAAVSVETINGVAVKEYDLYPILSNYLWNGLGIYSKRIDEKRSSNANGKNGNKWLHPDLVGMEDLSRDWHDEIKNCVNQYSDKKTKLWSFEVKILINRSNVREVYFQTVSNSSWANFGYLVARDIVGVDGELRMLAGRHGIGVITLDADNPTESEITIPAVERNEIDWDTANRLTKENTDFKKYIGFIRKFYQTGEIDSHNWDMPEILEDDDE